MKLFSRVRDGRLRHVRFCGIRLFSYVSSHAEKIVAPPGNEVANVPCGCKVTICGRRNRVVFQPPLGDGFVGSVTIGTPDCPAHDCCVEFGPGCTANGVAVHLLEHGSRLTVGGDCMFSSEVTVWLSDTHAITDPAGQLLNRGREVVLGDHVWIGQGATILKNTTLPDGTIVGTKSVVGGRKWTTPNAILAGNPAREVRRDVRWSRDRPNAFL